MHEQAKQFTMSVARMYPEYFSNKIVLDVGSGDINGNNRFLFKNCMYEGNDVIDAPNVTVVSKTKHLQFPPQFFDTIISTECFEHDPEYELSFKKIVELLKPNGLFLFTCASTNRPEHGTRRTTMGDSYGTIGNLTDMQDYYKNLTIEDVCKCINLNETFKVWQSTYDSSPCDMYFWGIKK